MPSSICKALDELPTTLNDTYERALQEIPKEKRQHAHRLFQCLVAAIRPLNVEELAEIFAIRFDGDRALDLMEGWRPESPDEAVLSACSTLIAIIEIDGSKIVQFSHFSVKEYLTSDRLQTSEVGNILNYHIPLDAAHTILARACLAVLLQLDEKVDRVRLATFPLALYAARHWVDHAKFKDVALRIQEDMERLFNPRNPYLRAWVWICDADWGYGHSFAEHPTPTNGTALYYASLCGFSGVANYIVCTHGEDANAKSGHHGTPLHAATYKGHIEVVRVLLDHGANINATRRDKETPLNAAYRGKHLEVMQLLLEHGADANAGGPLNWKPLHSASFEGHADVVQLLLDHGADINALTFAHDTPLGKAVTEGHLEVVRLLLEHGADVNIGGWTPYEHGADVNIGGQVGGWTPYREAESKGLIEIAQLLLEHGAEKK
jgi:hypothetical protein